MSTATRAARGGLRISWSLARDLARRWRLLLGAGWVAAGLWLAGLESLLVAVGVVVLLGVTVLVVWREVAPASFEQGLAGPSRRRGWRRWARRSWPGLSRACGLSTSERVEQRTRDGGSKSVTRWTHPALVGVSTSEAMLTLTVRARVGQTVEDLEAVSAAVRVAAGAHSIRATIEGPGVLRWQLVMGEYLSVVRPASLPAEVCTDAAVLGRREDGQPWSLRVAGRHTLVAGCSGSGKGSIFWGIAGGLALGVRQGLVRLYGIDLKMGMEVGLGRGLFCSVATTEAEAVAVLERVEQLMRARGERMGGQLRSHTASRDEPLVVVMIDELAQLTAYVTEPEIKKRAAALLSRILTMGRALGVVVVACLQDPRKEVIPARGLFTQTVALRLRSREEVTMVLGEGLSGVAPAHRISPERPGTAYVVAEDGHTIRVRANYWPDGLIRSVSTSCATPLRETIMLPQTGDQDAEAGSGRGSTTGQGPGGGSPRTPRAPRSGGPADRANRERGTSRGRS